MIQCVLPGGAKGTLFKACSTAILTFDSVNVVHRDKADKRSKKMQKEVLSSIESSLMAEFKDERTNAEYIKAFDDKHELGLATTCGYQFIAKPPLVLDEIDVMQYFLYDGLGTAVRMRNYFGHTFYGHAVDHRTAQYLSLIHI